MYRKQQYSIETPENLKNLFGGQLDEENRWIEMSKMILWELDSGKFMDAR